MADFQTTVVAVVAAVVVGWTCWPKTGSEGVIGTTPSPPVPIFNKIDENGNEFYDLEKRMNENVPDIRKI